MWVKMFTKLGHSTKGSSKEKLNKSVAKNVSLYKWFKVFIELLSNPCKMIIMYWRFHAKNPKEQKELQKSSLVFGSVGNYWKYS